MESVAASAGPSMGASTPPSVLGDPELDPPDEQPKHRTRTTPNPIRMRDQHSASARAVRVWHALE
jgi:hypothetical protein